MAFLFDRDLLVGNRPAIFAGNSALYATAALAAAGTDRSLTAIHLGSYAATPVSVTLGCGIRLLPVRYGWDLPNVERVLWADEIPANVLVSGHLYDVVTGLLTTVVDAKAKK